jgi:LEA14-like dessication related protein
MKKSWLFIILGVLVATVISLYFKVKTWGKNVTYGIADGVKLNNISVKGISVFLPIWIYNPTPMNIVISNLDLKVYFNGYYVSNIQSRSNYQLLNKRNSTYPLLINVDPASTLKLLAEQGQIINEKDWLDQINVRVEGSVKMDFGLISINNLKINLEDSLKTYVV